MPTQRAPEAESQAWNARWIPATVLLAAATLKILSAPLVLEGGGLLSSPLLLYATIFVEVLCSVLITLLPARFSWLLAVVFFSLLLLVAVSAQIWGVSCNCFGSTLPSWISILIDVSILVTCLVARPQRGGLKTSIKKAVYSAIGAAVLGVCIAFYLNATAEKGDPLQYLLADKLVGRPWPIGHSLAKSLAPLESGNWMIIIVREDCIHCREILDNTFPKAQRHREKERTAIMIAGSGEWPFVLDQVSLEARPAGSIVWPSQEPFVASPAVFIVRDGFVLSAADGRASKSFIKSLFDN